MGRLAYRLATNDRTSIDLCDHCATASALAADCAAAQHSRAHVVAVPEPMRTTASTPCTRQPQLPTPTPQNTKPPPKTARCVRFRPTARGHR